MDMRDLRADAAFDTKRNLAMAKATARPPAWQRVQHWRAALLATTGLVALTVAQPAMAQTRWTGAVDDDWNTAGNWDTNAVPGSSDLAVMDFNGLVDPIPMIGAGDTAQAGTVTIGVTSAFSALLIENGGTLTSTGEDIAGFEATGRGVIEADGPGSQWTGDALVLGREGTGILRIKNQGQVVTNGPATLCAEAGSEGEAEVSGACSQWTNSPALVVGSAGEATLNILNGPGVVTVSLLPAQPDLSRRNQYRSKPGTGRPREGGLARHGKRPPKPSSDHKQRRREWGRCPCRASPAHAGSIGIVTISPKRPTFLFACV